MTYPPQGNGPQNYGSQDQVFDQNAYQAPQPPYEPQSGVGAAAWGQAPADYAPQQQAPQQHVAGSYAPQHESYAPPHDTYVAPQSFSSQQGGGLSAYSTGGASQAHRPAAQGILEASDGRNVGELVSDLTQKFSTLMQQEVALAKAEATQEAKKAGKGGGMLAGAGVAAFFAVLFLSLAIWWALGVLIGSPEAPALGWSGLIMTVLWAVIAGILAMLGRNELKRVRALPETTNSVSKIPEALKGNEEMNR